MPIACTSSAQAALVQCAAWHLRLDKYSGELADAAIPEKDAIPPKTSALRAALACYTNKSKPQLATVIKAKLAWLDRIADQSGETHHRSIRLLAETKLLVGLGRTHALENIGIAFERTTGLPLIPGTAIKGVVSTWAAWTAAGDGLFQDPPLIPTARSEFTAEDSALARRILGDNSADGSTSAGDVIFLGGFPETAPTLGLDIVNPHHETDGAIKRNLTPNIFLCLEPGSSTAGTTWRFPIIVRAGAEEPAKLLQVAGDWLANALTQSGIGAKTAAGYGRFRPTAGISKSASSASSDYSETTFASILDRMNNAGAVQQFQADLKLLQLPQNAMWLSKLKNYLAGPTGKDARKRLKDKEWFPKNLLHTP